MKISVIKENAPAYAIALSQAGYIEVAKQFEQTFWGSLKDRVEIELMTVPDEAVSQVLLDVSTELGDRYAIRESRLFLVIAQDGETTVIKSLKTFAKTLESYIASNIQRGWIYRMCAANTYLPYLITNIRHVKANPQYQREACVEISLDYSTPFDSDNSKGGTISYGLKDVHGSTVPQILAQKGYFKENDAFYEEYIKHVKAYEQYVGDMGKLFWASGTGVIKENYSTESIKMKRSKMVNDEDTNQRKRIRQTTSISILNGVRTSLDFIDEDTLDGEIEDFDFKTYQVPFHPYVNMFSLELHCNVRVLADCLEPYQYNKEIGKKLILPKDHYDLIDILVNDADVVLQDIVDDKSGGTNILCKGEAGLGKTLTAEVYSEVVGKPLYSVHSGQLGNDPTTIDKKLKEILDRATRWKAILLLDEADVYIRKRDNSMDHNAIVAAFLRQLERFEGIIFLTTNRANDVDDAIASRCIAQIFYDYPDKERLTQIWEMLSTHYGLAVDSELIADIIASADKMGGRDVKELLKLAYKYHTRRDMKMCYEMFRKCAMFRGIDFKEDRKKTA